MRFEPTTLRVLDRMLYCIPFNLTGKLIMVFLTGQSLHICKCYFTGGPGGAQNQDFSAVSQGDLTRSLVLSVAQASPLGINV